MTVEQAKNINLNFILTTARTGSTLLSTMLNSHPSVVSTIEEPFAYSLFPKYEKIKKWTSETIQDYCNDFYLFSEGRLAVEFGTRQELITILEKYKDHLDVQLAIRLSYLCFFPQKNKESITTVVDKQLTMHECISDVMSFYPNSKFIILHRDPRDNAVTKWRLFEKRGLTLEKNYYKMAIDWNYVYGILKNAQNKFPERFIEIKYEDLVAEPEAELKKICSFLKIAYDPIMLEYDKLLKQELDTPFYRNMDETAKKYFLSIQGGLFVKPDKEKIGYWKKTLTADEANLIWMINEKLAVQAGYTVHEGYKRTSVPFKKYIGLYPIAKDRIKSLIYYKSPFAFRRLVKKIKYGNNDSHPRNTQSSYFKTNFKNKAQ